MLPGLAAVPRRAPGVDPGEVLDGSDPATEWRGFHDPAGAELARAIDRLARWDRVADTASVETTWFTLMVERRMALRSDPPSWVAALADALRLLREEWGTTEVTWGQLNRHQRPLPGDPARALDPDRPSLPVGGASGGFGSVFSYYSAPVDGPAGPRIGLAGNSFVKVIEFGPTPTARSVLNYGLSGDPASRHFFDQAELYVRRAFKPAWFTRAEVEANAVRSYGVGATAGER
jgi:acyl-homoserine lactone acylase PvdQ